jgi:CheY-like chemotaxis protein
MAPSNALADARVLIVEDNEDDAVLTLRALSDVVSPSKTMIAEHGERALDYLFGTGEFAGRDDRSQPDFILLDLDLPGLHGLEVLGRIRGDPRTRFVPIIVLSGADAKDTRKAAYKQGANSFLVKPAESETFESLVKRAGRYWLSVNRVVPTIRAGFLR